MMSQYLLYLLLESGNEECVIFLQFDGTKFLEIYLSSSVYRSKEYTCCMVELVYVTILFTLIVYLISSLEVGYPHWECL